MNMTTTITPVTTKDPSTAPLRAILAERNALSDWFNEPARASDEDPDAAAAAVSADIDRLETAIIERRAANRDEAAVKLVALVQIAASGREIEEAEAISALADARRHFDLGYLHPGQAEMVEADLPASSDQPLLDAFAARRRDFEAFYHVDMTREQEDAYYARLDATEKVIDETPATTIEGVIAKLRISFMHHTGWAWADRAIMDPSHPDFVAGLAEADIYTRMKWAAIEDLARIGGVELAEQGA